MNQTMIPAWIDGELKPVEKMYVHEFGLRHKAVSVFVVAGKKVLLQRRAMHKYHTPGQWANTCCTHPEWGEDPRDCANRRLDEELGITGLNPIKTDHVEYRADVGGGMIEHEEVDIFLAHTDLSLDVTPNPDEVMATRWVDLYDLIAEAQRFPARFTPWLKIYLSEHKSGIFGALVAS